MLDLATGVNIGGTLPQILFPHLSLILGKLTSDTSNTNLNILAGPLFLGAALKWLHPYASFVVLDFLFFC